MTIIFGGGAKMKNPGGLWVPYLCRGCDGMAAFLVVENYKYGHVYGIRVAKYKTKYFLVCSTCQRTHVIETKEQFAIAQEIARRIAASPADGTDLFVEVGNVARFVLGDRDLADAIARAAANTEETAQSAAPVSGPAQAIGGDEKTCPDCAETIKAAARKCRFCGYEYDR